MLGLFSHRGPSQNGPSQNGPSQNGPFRRSGKSCSWTTVVVMCPAMASTSVGVDGRDVGGAVAVQVERTDPVEPAAQRDRDDAPQRVWVINRSWKIGHR